MRVQGGEAGIDANGSTRHPRPTPRSARTVLAAQFNLDGPESDRLSVIKVNPRMASQFSDLCLRVLGAVAWRSILTRHRPYEAAPTGRAAGSQIAVGFCARTGIGHTPGQTARGQHVLPSIRLESNMPKFVIERHIPQIGAASPSDLHAISQKSCSVLRDLGPEVQWVHSYVTGDKIYCVYNAASEDIVREHAKRGGFPADSVARVVTTIDPTTAEA